MNKEELSQTKLWTAIITPMLEDGAVDYKSFETLLNKQADAKAGIVVLGSTGEALNIGLKERTEIVEFAQGLKLNVPMMVGIGGSNIDEQKEWIQFLNEKNVHCYLVVTPLYAKPGTIGQQKWFEELMDTSNRPCMLYNVPSRTGIKMSFDAIKAVKDHKNFWAIKEASGSVEEFKQYSQSAPNAKMYSGDDGLLPQFCQVVKDVGLVSVISNVWPKACQEYVKLCNEHKFDQVDMWPAVADTLFIASNPIPAKALLHENGLITTAKLRAPLTDLDLTDRSPLIASHNKVTSWSKERGINE